MLLEFTFSDLNKQSSLNNSDSFTNFMITQVTRSKFERKCRSTKNHLYSSTCFITKLLILLALDNAITIQNVINSISRIQNVSEFIPKFVSICL